MEGAARITSSPSSITFFSSSLLLLPSSLPLLLFPFPSSLILFSQLLVRTQPLTARDLLFFSFLLISHSTHPTPLTRWRRVLFTLRGEFSSIGSFSRKSDRIAPCHLAYRRDVSSRGHSKDFGDFRDSISSLSFEIRRERIPRVKKKVFFCVFPADDNWFFMKNINK